MWTVKGSVLRPCCIGPCGQLRKPRERMIVYSLEVTAAEAPDWRRAG